MQTTNQTPKIQNPKSKFRKFTLKLNCVFWSVLPYFWPSEGGALPDMFAKKKIAYQALFSL